MFNWHKKNKSNEMARNVLSHESKAANLKLPKCDYREDGGANFQLVLLLPYLKLDSASRSQVYSITGEHANWRYITIFLNISQIRFFVIEQILAF